MAVSGGHHWTSPALSPPSSPLAQPPCCLSMARMSHMCCLCSSACVTHTDSLSAHNHLRGCYPRFTLQETKCKETHVLRATEDQGFEPRTCGSGIRPIGHHEQGSSWWKGMERAHRAPQKPGEWGAGRMPSCLWHLAGSWAWAWNESAHFILSL